MSETSNAPVLVLFRHDLRLDDNLALSAAADSGHPVLAVYVEDLSEGIRPLGAAARWWRARSLRSLKKALSDSFGIRLICRRGPLAEAVMGLIGQGQIKAIYINRRFEPAADKADDLLEVECGHHAIPVHRFEGQLLHDPNRLKTSTGGFYKVFTPFWRALSSTDSIADPADPPESLRAYKHELEDDPDGLLEYDPPWAKGFDKIWQPGEAGASERLEQFLEGRGEGYSTGRDFMAMEVTSRLSPHLAHGEITPRQIMAASARSKLPPADLETFRKELGWREFCWHLLVHNPHLATENYDTRFNHFPWNTDNAFLTHWKRGRTGYPLVDAAMRQLWETGWMHNRARMVVASFLVKHLGLHWKEGEAWFWDTLVDADAANNPANWQWVAGTGADAAPFFRIFNPTLQSRKFDTRGEYIRTYVRELSALDSRQLHEPPAELRESYAYPAPVVDHSQARESALTAYRSIR